jgi:Domain of unknown function (DUF5666)
MKLTSLKPALVAVLGLALAGALVTVKAQTPTAAPAASTNEQVPAKTPPATATATKKTPYKGKITAIDASSVTVQGAKAPMTLAVTADTKFQFGTSKKNTPATAADFAVGDSVTGSYLKNADGTMTAETVRKKQAAK